MHGHAQYKDKRSRTVLKSRNTVEDSWCKNKNSIISCGSTDAFSSCSKYNTTILSGYLPIFLGGSRNYVFLFKIVFHCECMHYSRSTVHVYISLIPSHDSVMNIQRMLIRLLNIHSVQLSVDFVQEMWCFAINYSADIALL